VTDPERAARLGALAATVSEPVSPG
jgi:hypothetical protein